MSLIPFAITWLLGWGAYHSLYRQHAKITPLTVGLFWLLGAGSVHIVYYLSILLAQRNPPHIVFYLLCIPIVIDLIRYLRQPKVTGWSLFAEQPRWSLSLLGVMSIIFFLTAVLGYANDTVSMWAGKALALEQHPNYMDLIANFSPHPDYPPLFTHQYQWQFSFEQSVLGSKLPTLGFYIAMISAMASLLENHPRSVMWMAFAVGIPTQYFFVPIGLADMPVGVYGLMGVALLEQFETTENRVDLIAAGIMLGLMTLVKQEGLLLFSAIYFTMLVLYFIRRVTSKSVAGNLTFSHLLLIGFIAVVFMVSWRALLLGGDVIPSDFRLSQFNVDRIPELMQLALPILFNPIGFAGLWLFVFVFLSLGFWDHPLVWMPCVLYILAITAAYSLSNYRSLEDHILDSYDRILHQVIPFGMVYLAAVLDPAYGGSTKRFNILGVNTINSDGLSG